MAPSLSPCCTVWHTWHTFTCAVLTPGRGEGHHREVAHGGNPWSCPRQQACPPHTPRSGWRRHQASKGGEPTPGFRRCGLGSARCPAPGGTDPGRRWPPDPQTAAWPQWPRTAPLAPAAAPLWGPPGAGSQTCSASPVGREQSEGWSGAGPPTVINAAPAPAPP